MSSDRQAELQRQRALLQAQLSRLDQEIASPQNPAAAPVPAPQPGVPANPPPAQPASTGTAPNPDSLLDPYRNETTDTVQNVRRGCYLAFALALLLLVGSVLAIYFFRHVPPPVK